MIYIYCLLFLAIFAWFLPTYLTHWSISNYQRSVRKIKWASFSNFKREFYKVEWCRSSGWRYAYFNRDTMDRMSFDLNYIHASIVIVNGTQFVFEPISFIRFQIFLFLNRTTEKNVNIRVNTLKQKRKLKLEKLKI